MGIVTDDLEVVKGEGVDILLFRVDFQNRKRSRLARELLFERLHVVRVYVRVSAAVHKITRFQTANLRNHAREQGIRSDIERNAQTHVARALVHLAAQLAVGNVKLAEHVARWQRHLLQRRRIPRRE